MPDLTYKECLELKKAGFPQKEIEEGDNILIDKEHGQFIEGEEVITEVDGIREPSLEELIEGCGDGFHSLHRIANDDGSLEFWRVINVDIIPTSFRGNSPSQAVFRLYISLNKHE